MEKDRGTEVKGKMRREWKGEEREGERRGKGKGGLGDRPPPKYFASRTPLSDRPMDLS